MTNYDISNNTLKFKEDYVNRRISFDLKKHNWLIEKLLEKKLIRKTDTVTQNLKSPKRKPEMPKSVPKCRKESVAVERSTPELISKSTEEKEKELDKYLEYAKRLYRKLKDRKKLNLHSRPKQNKYKKKIKVEKKKKTNKSAPSFGTVEDLFNNIKLFEKENKEESTNSHVKVKNSKSLDAVNCKQRKNPEKATKIDIENNKLGKNKLSSRIKKHKVKDEENAKTINFKLKNNLTYRINNFYNIANDNVKKKDSKITKKIKKDNHVSIKTQHLSPILNNFKNSKKGTEPEEINVVIKKEYLFSDTSEKLQKDNRVSIEKKSLTPVSNYFKNSNTETKPKEINVNIRKEYLFANTPEKLQEDNHVSIKTEPISPIPNNFKNSIPETEPEDMNVTIRKEYLFSKTADKLQDRLKSITKEPLSPTSENFKKNNKETKPKEIIIISEDNKLKTYSVQAQTESVFIISAEEKEFIEFLKSNNLTKLSIENLLVEATSKSKEPILSMKKEATVIKDDEEETISNGITRQAELLQAFLTFCDEYKKTIDELGEKIAICTQYSTKETENQEIASLAELIGKELDKMSQESYNINQNLDRMIQSHQNQVLNTTTPIQCTQGLPNNICQEIQQLQNIFPHHQNNQQHFGQQIQSLTNQHPNIQQYQSLNTRVNLNPQVFQQTNPNHKQQQPFHLQSHQILNQHSNQHQSSQQHTSAAQMTLQRYQIQQHSQSSALHDLLLEPDPLQLYQRQQLPRLQQNQQRLPVLQQNHQRQQDIHRLSQIVPPIGPYQEQLLSTPQRPTTTSQPPSQLGNFSQTFQTTYNNTQLPPNTTNSLQSSNYQQYPPNQPQTWRVPLS